MKFKILDVKIVANNVQVAISHKDCIREVFGLPLELAKDNKYIDEIKKLLSERVSKKPKIDKTMIGKEIEL